MITPFAEREPVRLDHEGKSRLLHEGERGRALGEAGAARRRDLIFAHQFFRENFRGFEPRRGF